MRKIPLMAVVVLLSAGVASAQTWKQSWIDSLAHKNSLDGCYRAADKMAVCTFSVTSPSNSSLRFVFEDAYMTDQAGRRIYSVWGAAGASAPRIPADPQAPYRGSMVVNYIGNVASKISFGFPLSPQYSTANVTLRSHSLLGVPVVVPNTVTAPTSGTAGNYNVAFTNCVLNPGGTLACQSVLTPKK